MLILIVPQLLFKVYSGEGESTMRIAIIGCGNMGTALAQRLSKGNELFLHGRDPVWTEGLEKDGFGRSCRQIRDAIHQAEMVILAVKPDHLEEVADQISSSMKAEQILVSVLAGVTLETLKSYFPTPQLVRMMPNLSVTQGEGVIGLVSESHQQQAELSKLFKPLGKLYWLPEEKIDALTALTGSGPAFLFAIIESMVEAGVAMGFSAQVAQEMVIQMIKGSVTLLEETKKHPAELKWRIASPGGTTIAGLVELERSNLRSAVIEPFLAAYNRAKGI